MKNPYFIINPVAGGGSALGRFAEIERRLKDLSIQYTAHYTESPGHACVLTKKAIENGCGCIIAVGGDGTVREVAQELLYSDISLGILPVGTGNDLAKALGISSDCTAAFSQLLSCKPSPMDAATANGKIFLNASGFGFDVDVLVKTERYKRRFGGGTAYILGVLHALAGLKRLHIKAALPDGGIDTDISLLAVGNGAYFGGGMKVAPLADVADGLLDFCIVRAISRRRLLALLPKFIKGHHLEFNFIKYIKAEKVTVACSPPARVQLDGEIIEQTPVTFKVLPGALMVIRPLTSDNL